MTRSPSTEMYGVWDWTPKYSQTDSQKSSMSVIDQV